jgi:hypothetical protein
MFAAKYDTWARIITRSRSTGSSTPWSFSRRLESSELKVLNWIRNRIRSLPSM